MSIQPELHELVAEGISLIATKDLFEELRDLIGSTSHRDILRAEAIANELEYRTERLSRVPMSVFSKN